MWPCDELVCWQVTGHADALATRSAGYHILCTEKCFPAFLACDPSKYSNVYLLPLIIGCKWLLVCDQFNLRISFLFYLRRKQKLRIAEVKLSCESQEKQNYQRKVWKQFTWFFVAVICFLLSNCVNYLVTPEVGNHCAILCLTLLKFNIIQ